MRDWIWDGLVVSVTTYAKKKKKALHWYQNIVKVCVKRLAVIDWLAKKKTLKEESWQKLRYEKDDTNPSKGGTTCNAKKNSDWEYYLDEWVL